MVETFCLTHKLEDTLSMLLSILTDTQFQSPENLPHLKTLLTSSASSASASVASSGHQLAAIRAELGLTSVAAQHEW